MDRTKNLPEQNMNAIEKFNTLRKLHFEFIKGGRNLMIIKPELTEKKEIHQEVFELKFKLFDIAQKIIEQGQEENVFRKDIKPEESMIILDSMMTGIMFQASVVREVGYGPFKHFDVENMIRRALDHFFLAITNTNGVINK